MLRFSHRSTRVYVQGIGKYVRSARGGRAVWVPSVTLPQTKVRGKRCSLSEPITEPFSRKYKYYDVSSGNHLDAYTDAVHISEFAVKAMQWANAEGLINGKTLEQPSIYAHAENWAYMEIDETADADVFFICPAVYGGGADSFNMSMDDEVTKGDFLGAINMEI